MVAEQVLVKTLEGRSIGVYVGEGKKIIDIKVEIEAIAYKPL